MTKNRKATPEAKILLADAFDFLEQLKPGSVDLIVSSPPYFMGKEYDTSLKIEDFIAHHRRLLPLLHRALKQGGNLCWQVGHHVQKSVVTPLDAVVYSVFADNPELFLRNRIVWTFGHGAHARDRLSGRHETILWYSKGENYHFNLDAIRVPQRYPGKRHYKGPKKGELSGNPLGKNPSDVWDIPNVKAKHVEKTDHPCQFPVALVQRLVKGLCPKNGLVVDPFMGSGSAGVAALLEQRSFAGCDNNKRYVKLTEKRIQDVLAGTAKYRALDKRPYVPDINSAVATRPAHFLEW